MTQMVGVVGDANTDARTKRSAIAEDAILNGGDMKDANNQSPMLKDGHFDNDGHDHKDDIITIGADGKVKKRCFGKKK